MRHASPDDRRRALHPGRARRRLRRQPARGLLSAYFPEAVPVGQGGPKGTERAGLPSTSSPRGRKAPDKPFAQLLGKIRSATTRRTIRHPPYLLFLGLQHPPPVL